MLPTPRLPRPWRWWARCHVPDRWRCRVILINVNCPSRMRQPIALHASQRAVSVDVQKILGAALVKVMGIREGIENPVATSGVDPFILVDARSVIQRFGDDQLWGAPFAGVNLECAGLNLDLLGAACNNASGPKGFTGQSIVDSLRCGFASTGPSPEPR